MNYTSRPPSRGYATRFPGGNTGTRSSFSKTSSRPHSSHGSHSGSRIVTGASSRSQSSPSGFSPGFSRSAGRNAGRFGAKKGRGRGTPAIDISEFIRKSKMSVTEEIPEYTPEHIFSDFALDRRLKNNIASHGYVTPTPIQDKAIPHILSGTDVIGVANTGTGKTAAFLIPLIHKTLENLARKTIIIVPTRELALQIHDELRNFARGLGIFGVSVIGGAGIGEQTRALRGKHHFVIGTPGRLKDLIERKALDMSGFGTIVLDEADRMLDMGFINDMKFILAKMPTPRHTLLFSATFSREIENLVQTFLSHPVKISVKTQETAASVEQEVLRVGSDRAKKMDHLHELLIRADFGKVLVFGETKHGVEKLSKELLARGFKAASIHGNKNQSQRKRALSLFKDNQVKILVATDVAARGLDIDNISHVINYDIPRTYDDYIHRIGRTGRGGKKGAAITFVE